MDGAAARARDWFLAVFGALLAEQLAQLLTALPGAVSRVTEWANRTFDTNFSTGDDLLKLTPDTIRELAQRFTPTLERPIVDGSARAVVQKPASGR